MGTRHLTTALITNSDDPVSDIISSGREVTPEDVEVLWADLIEGRRSWRETSQRAQALIDTVNATHIANWGLLKLYYLWQDNASRDTDSQILERENWRNHVREYDADPVAWNRRYYQRMITDHASRFGTDAAKRFGGKLVREGVLRDEDVALALQPPDDAPD